MISLSLSLSSISLSLIFFNSFLFLILPLVLFLLVEFCFLKSNSEILFKWSEIKNERFENLVLPVSSLLRVGHLLTTAVCQASVIHWPLLVVKRRSSADHYWWSSDLHLLTTAGICWPLLESDGHFWNLLTTTGGQASVIHWPLPMVKRHSSADHCCWSSDGQVKVGFWRFYSEISPEYGAK